MKKIAFVFPGQGSQSVGMGADIFENYECAKNIYNKSNEFLEKNLSKLCFEGPEEDLKLTTNTQPAILTTSIALLEAFKEESKIHPDYVAGHSLGEYVAMYEAEVLSLKNTFKLIQKRADAMSKAQCGGMAAVLALEDDKVKEILSKVTSGYVDVANYNCPGQVVITGETEAIKEASELLMKAGAKRVVPLAVSGAFHSKLMENASKEFEISLNNIEIKDAKIPVLTNVDAQKTTKSADFKEKMPKQIYSSVLWTQTIQNMIKDEVDTFVEIGNGKVLAGLIKKIDREVKVYNVYDTATLKEVSKAIRE